MQVQFSTIDLKKKVPIRISRGVKDRQRNLFLKITDGDHVGLGETYPNISEGVATAEDAQESLEAFLRAKPQLNSTWINYREALEAKVPTCALAGLDIALWDLRAKQAQIPLHQLLGFRKPRTKTSVTLGIMNPQEVKERLLVQHP